MIRHLAVFISIVFHPLFQTTLLAGVIYMFVPELVRPFDKSTIPNLLFLLAMLTCVIPFVSVGALRLIGAISSVRMEDRRERLIPFFFIGCYYALTLYLFSQRVILSDVMITIILTTTILVFLIFLATFFMKISVHAAASWGIVGFLLAIHLHLPDSPLLFPLIAVILLAGIICSARLYLDSHTPAEVNAGGILGFVLCFGTLYLTF